MTYNVGVNTIAQDISEEVKDAILEFLKSYDFPYVTTVADKSALKQVFIEHFQKRTSLELLRKQIFRLTRGDNRATTAVAMTETNRLHTKGLGTVLLSKGQAKCKTTHTYGNTLMQTSCRNNLEGKTLDIREVVTNSFPKTIEELNRKDIPMIPQHPNCRHVMAPLE